MKLGTSIALMAFFLFLVLGIYVFEPNQTQSSAKTSTLMGLKALNIEELGPWVVQPSGALTKADNTTMAINNELCLLTRERLKDESIVVNQKVNSPKLKLLLNYGTEQQKLALRGTRQLESVKLILEDDVDLDRQPPRVVPLVTWSASVDTKAGSGNEFEIRTQFEQLLNQFLNDLHKSHNAVAGEDSKAQELAALEIIS